MSPILEDGSFVNRHCPFCGGMVAPKIEYCTHCGYDLPPEQPPMPVALAETQKLVPPEGNSST